MPFATASKLQLMFPYIVPILTTSLIICCYNYRKRRNESELAKKALLEAELSLRLILDSTGEAIYGVDLEGNCTFINAMCVKILGYNHQKQLVGKKMHSVIHHSYADGSPCPVEECRISNALQLGEGACGDDELLWRSDGTGFAAEFRSYPQLKDAETVGAVVIIHDITERKQAEAARKENERLFQELQTVAHIGSYVTDLKTGIWKGSQELYAIYGIDESYPNTAEGWRQLLHPDSREKVYEHGAKVEAEQRRFDLEYQIIRICDGKERWVHGQGELICDEKSRAIKRSGTIQDVTERKQREIQLHNALAEGQRFREALDNIPSSVYIKDTQSRYMYANQATLQLFGCSAEELAGRDDTHFFPPDVAKWMCDVDTRVLHGEETTEEIEVSDAESNRRVYFEVKSPLYVHPGDKTICGLLGISTDITDRKRTEEEKLALEQKFQQTQKLESLGVLAGGIAHDFNNILAIIMGYCSLTEMDYGTAENNLPEIKKAAERAAGLCRQMFAYAGKAQLTKSQVDFSMLTTEMLNMLIPTLPKNAVIKSAPSTDIPFIYADASQLRQVVMNLIVNATEAIGKEHGEIRVSLAKIAVTGGKSGRDYHGKIIPSGEYVCLEVTDNGCGMDEETKWRIFEPFFTTKFAGRGLGMSAVLGIIKTHDGALQLFSQPGQGTTFKVFLPVPARAASEEKNQEPSVPSDQWQGSGTILLVEDEDQLRLVVKTMLKKFGFTVLEAENGREALELYHKNVTDITLILTDLGMPVMDGCELFYKLKILNQRLPIIISSGFGDVEVSARIAGADIAGLISKPYDPDQLREVLKRVLEGAQVGQS